MGDAPTIFLLTPFIISWQLTEDEALLEWPRAAVLQQEYAGAKGKGSTVGDCRDAGSTFPAPSVSSSAGSLPADSLLYAKLHRLLLLSLSVS